MPKPHEQVTLTPAFAKLLASDGPVLAAILPALPQALAVYAFGSQVQGHAGHESDLDLAVLVAGYTDPLVLWDLSGTLADIASCPVDVLDLRAASTVMQYQVLTTGLRLWAKEPATGLFESFVLSEKTALDMARAGLLADIQKEGKIYGR
ncbi:type VII toxin-antitoxin system MntA family adenylyltransferase antitoxin [Andreprevotia chitinilytica]|uniref:type VII toxin-antitoxin system MntA family adenylyltransferase antitoxin n=1 Tax=Andreprevotia chitinilytica TaxID=396808 RepID=UPI000A66BD0C|nr:nucleotidyltransferase domain-containing protein [Andreprevotia chitinilytica]